MTKVIKPRQKEEPPTYRATCPNCGAVLEYRDSDVYVHPERGWIPKFAYRCIVCPECHRGIALARGRIKSPYLLGIYGGLDASTLRTSGFGTEGKKS